MTEQSTPSTDGVTRSFHITNRMVVAIALPMTLAFLTTPLLGLVDTGVVGQLGDPALLGGLAVGAILFDILFALFAFLRSSTTGLVAQAMGAGDDEQQRIICVRALILGLVCGVIVLILAPLVLRFGLSFMKVPDAVAAATSTYFSVRVLAAPFTLLNYSVLGWLLGLARAKTGLVLQTVLNGANIILSLYLGLHLGWGLSGVAWATVIAELIAAILGLFLFWHATYKRPAINWPRVFNRAALLRLMGVNRDIMIRSFSLILAFAFFTSKGADYGEVTLAANAILMNFFMISGFLLDGFATAAEQLAGRALGANYRPAFHRAIKLTLIWGFVLAGIATVIFLITGGWLIDLLTINTEVRDVAREYLIWAALTAIIGVAAFQMDGVYIGATWSSDMRNMMLLSLVAYFLILYTASGPLGNHGLWLALEVFLGMRGITLLARLPSKIKQSFA